MVREQGVGIQKIGPAEGIEERAGLRVRDVQVLSTPVFDRGDLTAGLSLPRDYPLLMLGESI